MDKIDKVKGLLKKSALVAAGGALIGASLGGANLDPIDQAFDFEDDVTDVAKDQSDVDQDSTRQVENEETRTESSKMVDQMVQDVESEGEVERQLYSC